MKRADGLMLARDAKAEWERLRLVLQAEEQRSRELQTDLLETRRALKMALGEVENLRRAVDDQKASLDRKKRQFARVKAELDRCVRAGIPFTPGDLEDVMKEEK